MNHKHFVRGHFTTRELSFNSQEGEDGEEEAQEGLGVKLMAPKLVSASVCRNFGENASLQDPQPPPFATRTISAKELKLYLEIFCRLFNIQVLNYSWLFLRIHTNECEFSVIE